MAITALEQDCVSRGMIVAKKMLDLYGELKQLNVLYDSTGGVKTTVTQEELDSITSWSGLTKAQLDDGFYALTNGLLTPLNDSLNQLTELAARV